MGQAVHWIAPVKRSNGSSNNASSNLAEPTRLRPSGCVRKRPTARNHPTAYKRPIVRESSARNSTVRKAIVLNSTVRVSNVRKANRVRPIWTACASG